jgi:hypothetical protein
MQISSKVILNKLPSDGDAGWGFSMSPSNIAIGDKDDGSLDYSNAKSTALCNYGGLTGSTVILNILSASNCTAEILNGNILHITSVNTKVISYPYNGSTYMDSAYCPNGYVIISVQGSLGSNTSTVNIRVDFTATGYIKASTNDFIARKLVTENGEIQVSISEIKQEGDEIRASINDSVEGKNLLNQTDWDGKNISDLTAWTVPASASFSEEYYKLKTAMLLSVGSGGPEITLKQNINKALLNTSSWYSFSFYADHTSTIRVTLQYIYLANSPCYIDGATYTSINSVIVHDFPASTSITRHVITFETPATFPATPVVNITCPAGCTSHVLMPMLNAGDVISWVGCFSSMRKALFDTNIDIKKKIITITADNTIIQDNNGTKTITSIVRRDETTGAILNDVNLVGDHVKIGTKKFGDVMSIQDDNVFFRGYIRTNEEEQLYPSSTTITNRFFVKDKLEVIIRKATASNNYYKCVYLPNDFEYIGTHIRIISSPNFYDTGETYSSPPYVYIRTGRNYMKHTYMEGSGTSSDPLLIPSDQVESLDTYDNKALSQQEILNAVGWYMGKIYSAGSPATKIKLKNGYVELLGIPSSVKKPIFPFSCTLNDGESGRPFNYRHALDNGDFIFGSDIDSAYNITNYADYGITLSPNSYYNVNNQGQILYANGIRYAPLCQWVILGSSAEDISFVDETIIDS